MGSLSKKTTLPQADVVIIYFEMEITSNYVRTVDFDVRTVKKQANSDLPKHISPIP